MMCDRKRKRLKEESEREKKQKEEGKRRSSCEVCGLHNQASEVMETGRLVI